MIWAILSFTYRLIITGDYRRLSLSLLSKVSLLGYKLSILLHSSLSYFTGPSIFCPPYFSTTNIKQIYYRTISLTSDRIGPSLYSSCSLPKIGVFFFFLTFSFIHCGYTQTIVHGETGLRIISPQLVTRHLGISVRDMSSHLSKVTGGKSSQLFTVESNNGIKGLAENRGIKEKKKCINLVWKKAPSRSDVQENNKKTGLDLLLKTATSEERIYASLSTYQSGPECHRKGGVYKESIVIRKLVQENNIYRCVTLNQNLESYKYLLYRFGINRGVLRCLLSVEHIDQEKEQRNYTYIAD